MLDSTRSYWQLSLTLVIIFALSINGHAQNKRNLSKGIKKDSKSGKVQMYKNPNPKQNDVSWQAVRLEYFLGLGPSGFLGDLGGQEGVAQPFVLDLNPTQTRWGVSAGARYFLREYHAVKGMFTYGRIRGSDAETTYPNRRYRNITVKSPIIELAGMYEFHILKPKYLHFAGAPSTKIWDGSRFGAYASAGVGLFYFNPKSELNGQWYALQPLNTEGQGLPGAPDPYSRLAWTFPLGGGVYMLMNRNYTLGLDVTYRWTTTDYIDDASGYYYNNSVIEENYGKLSAYFANPSVALDDVPNPNWYTQDQPRGGSQGNDTYLFVQVTLSKSLTPSITNKDFKQKKKKTKKTYKEKKKFKSKREKKAKTYRDSSKIKNSKKKFKAPKLDFGKRKKRTRITTF